MSQFLLGKKIFINRFHWEFRIRLPILSVFNSFVAGTFVGVVIQSSAQFTYTYNNDLVISNKFYFDEIFPEDTTTLIPTNYSDALYLTEKDVSRIRFRETVITEVTIIFSFRRDSLISVFTAYHVKPNQRRKNTWIFQSNENFVVFFEKKAEK